MKIKVRINSGEKFRKPYQDLIQCTICTNTEFLRRFIMLIAMNSLVICLTQILKAFTKRKYLWTLEPCWILVVFAL